MAGVDRAPAAEPREGGRARVAEQDSHTDHSSPRHTTAAAAAAERTGGPPGHAASGNYLE